MPQLLSWLTRSVIGAVVWKAVRRLGPLGSVLAVLAVSAIYLLTRQ